MGRSASTGEASREAGAGYRPREAGASFLERTLEHRDLPREIRRRIRTPCRDRVPPELPLRRDDGPRSDFRECVERDHSRGRFEDGLHPHPSVVDLGPPLRGGRRSLD